MYCVCNFIIWKALIVPMPHRFSSWSIGFCFRIPNIGGLNHVSINTIALVSTSTALQFTFHAMVRLMLTESESHLWDISLSSLGVKNATNAFDEYNDYYSSSCSADISLSLEKDRREWISSIEVQNTFSTFDQSLTRFKLYGRNSGEWVLLKDVENLIFTSVDQKKRINLNTNTP